MATSLKQGLVFPFLSFILGAVCALSLGEVAARRFALSKTWSSYIEGRMLMTYMDPSRDIGFTRIPKASFLASRGVMFDINSLGFRESEIGPKDGRIRVAFLGDSVTEGFGVDTPQRFSDYLQTRLNQESERWDALNLGVSAHATYDELHVLRNDALPLAPDYVVLQFCSNDFKRNRDTYLRKTGAHPPEGTETQGGDGGIKAVLQKHSALYLAIAERYNVHKLRNNVLGPTWEALLEIGVEEWSITEGKLIEFAEECRRNNIELVFMYVPLEVEVLVKDSRLGSALGVRFAELCARYDITYVDVVEPLRRQSNRRSVYLDDCHLSVLGNQIVGDTLYEHFVGLSGLEPL